MLGGEKVDVMALLSELAGDVDHEALRPAEAESGVQESHAELQGGGGERSGRRRRRRRRRRRGRGGSGRRKGRGVGGSHGGLNPYIWRISKVRYTR